MEHVLNNINNNYWEKCSVDYMIWWSWLTSIRILLEHKESKRDEKERIIDRRDAARAATDELQGEEIVLRAAKIV